MNNNTLTIAFASFSTVVLVAHMGTAYEVLRSGVIVLFSVAFIGLMAIALMNMGMAKAKLGWGSRNGQLVMAIVPHIGMAIALLTAIGLGVWSGLSH
jgi:hypothetical protein